MPKDELLNEAEKMILGLQEFEGKISLSREELKSWMVLFHQQLLNKHYVSRSAAKHKVEVLSVAEDGSIVFRYDPIV